MNFNEQLENGKIGESKIAMWFQNRNYNVLPVYEKEISEHKGPVLFQPNGKSLICPDMLVYKNGKAFWIEAKHKSAFSWHRITQRWVTGIDINHYEHYLKVAETNTSWPIYLLFLHKNGFVAKDTPTGLIPPTGLFGENLIYLSENENHRHAKWGKSGMVYWSSDVLKQYSAEYLL